MKTNTSARSGQILIDAHLLNQALEAIDKALDQTSTMAIEPDAVDVQDGTRLEWLTDDLLKARWALRVISSDARAATPAPREKANDSAVCRAARQTPDLWEQALSALWALAEADAEHGDLIGDLADELEQTRSGRAKQVPTKAKTAPPTAETNPSVTRDDVTNAGDFLAKVENALGDILEHVGQDSLGPEDWEAIHEGLARAWSGVRLAQTVLGLRREGGEP